MKTTFQILSTKKHAWRPYILRCQFPLCCNFFTSNISSTIKYCGNHLHNPNGKGRTTLSYQIYSRGKLNGVRKNARRII